MENSVCFVSYQSVGSILCIEFDLELRPIITRKLTLFKTVGAAARVETNFLVDLTAGVFNYVFGPDRKVLTLLRLD